MRDKKSAHFGGIVPWGYNKIKLSQNEKIYLVEFWSGNKKIWEKSEK